MVSPHRDESLLGVLETMAPGTELRDGLERILRGNTGALIVLGHDDKVESLSTGGFPLDIAFSATRLRELCKMDGAVVMSTDGARILRAAAHLMPGSDVPTEESGTRHRTAQRVSIQTGFPVISVSQSMRIIGVYVGGRRYVLESASQLLPRADQAIATLERYKSRLDEVSNTLTALEIEDLVTVRDVTVVLQRLEMVRRIEEEIVGYVVELGTDGRLLQLQLDELMAGVTVDRFAIVRDYVPAGLAARTVEQVLAELDTVDLLDQTLLAGTLGLSTAPETLDAPISPRGFRLLTRIPRLPAPMVDQMVEQFGSLQKLLAATVEDLQTIEGIGEGRARGIREALGRLADVSILDRFA